MKKMLVVIAVFFMLQGVEPLQGAGQAAGQSLGQWIKTTAGKIDLSSRARKRKPSAVAGVKGAEEKLDEGLYWKKESVSDEELGELKAAVSLASDGKNAEAKAAMEGFIKKHPASPLVKDAEEGLKLLGGPEGQIPEKK
ncbi:MAG: hypothetical protein HZB82_00770 [Deltaproteobacteria bacterium]|nr:hypothetical protein [Deltaproteobacteria bacterium]